MKADFHLHLFFSNGISLKTWDTMGMFEREVALYRRLQGHGASVTFITYGDSSDLEYAPRLPGIEILCNRWRMSPDHYKRWLSWRFAPRALSGTLIFKSNQISGAEVALAAARRAGASFIARGGNLPSFQIGRQEGKDSPPARRMRELEQAVLPKADKVILASPFMTSEVARDYAVPAHRLAVVPNYVETDVFVPSASAHAARTGRRLCFIGRLEAQKNVEALLEAISGLDVELCVVGSGSLEPKLKEYAREHGLSVEFMGNVANRELPAIINSCDLCVQPSLYEGHPKTILEAMSCGAAVIGGDAPGIREVIEHGRTGVLCGLSAPEIRSTVLAVLADSSLRERLGEAAREYVMRTVSLDRIVQMELAVYRELICARRRPRHVKTLSKTLDGLGRHQLEILLMDVVGARANELPPDEALRFLFRMDAAIYALTGQKAVAYGNGLHTKHRHMRYHDFFVSRVRRGENVLDIGCGNGALSYDVADLGGAEVLGMDINPDYINTARERYAHPRARYLLGDVLKDLPRQRFDVIIMSNVLEHLPNRAQFLQEIRSLADPARFLLRVPLYERDWRVPLKQELGVEWRLDPTHETEYTIEAFHSELAEAGLRLTCQEIRWGEIWGEAVASDA